MRVEQRKTGAKAAADRVPIRFVGPDVGLEQPVAALEDFLRSDDAAPRQLGREHRALTREAGLHRAHVRGRADRHLAAAAHLVEADAERVLGAFFIQSERARRRGSAADKPEELGGKPAFGHRPIRDADRECQARHYVGACGDRRDQVAPAHSAAFLRERERHRHRDDADVPAAQVVVVEHVAEAAVDEHRPRRRRLAAEAEDRALRLAAEVVHVIGNDLRFRRQAACADGDSERVEHALFRQLDERWRQSFVPERGRMTSQPARGVVARRCPESVGGNRGLAHLSLPVPGISRP